MALKKYTKDELKAAFRKLAEETGLPAEQIDGFAKALDHDGFAARVGSDLVLTRSDYSRVMNEEVAPARQRYETEYKKLVDTWYPQAQAEFSKAQTDLEAARKKIAAAEARYGDLDEAEELPGGKVRTESGDVVRKADFEKLMTEREAVVRAEVLNQTVGLQLQIQELASDHWNEFREVLDVRPLAAAIKTARERGNTEYSLPDAYRDQWGEKLDDKHKAADQKRIDDAVQAARVDERTKLRSSPVNSVDEESVGPFFAAQRLRESGKAPSEAELESDFVNGMRESAAAATAATTA